MSRRLKKLNQEQWELALSVVNRAWEASNSPLTTLSPPESLQHLKREDWEEISRCLWVLMQQKECSPLH